MCFAFPFPLLMPSGPHTHFLLQEGEQVLPGALLPHHCALQVRAGGCEMGMGGDKMVQHGPEGPEVEHS